MNKAERLVAIEEEIAIARTEAARLRAGFGALPRPPVAQRLAPFVVPHAPLTSTVRVADPAAPTPEDERVARQLGVSIDRVVATKLERERESRRRSAGLTDDDLRVARQVGVDPAELARVKGLRT